MLSQECPWKPCLYWSIVAVLALGTVLPLAAQQPKVVGVIGAKDKSRFVSVAFSPDGKTLAGICSATYPWKIKLYDPASGKLLASWDANSPTTRSLGFLAYRPDGKVLASVGQDKFVKVRFWDTETHQLIRKFDTGYYALAFSPNSNILATSGQGVGVQLRDPETGKKLKLLDFKRRSATLLVFSPDGKTLASISTKPAATVAQDGDITLSDPAAGKEKAIVSLKMTPLSLAFSPDGKTLACGGHEHYLNKIELWDLDAGKATTLFKDPKGKVGGGITGLAYRPDGKSLIVASSSQIALMDVATGRTKYVLEGPGNNTFTVSPDGATLAALGNTGFIRLWSLAAKKKK